VLPPVGKTVVEEVATPPAPTLPEPSVTPLLVKVTVPVIAPTPPFVTVAVNETDPPYVLPPEAVTVVAVGALPTVCVTVPLAGLFVVSPG
jgi:hypothetical protein